MAGGSVSSVKLQILNERYMGRYFQAAALGLILDSLPPQLSEKMLEGFEKGLVTLSEEESRELLETLTKKLRDLCRECKTEESRRDLAPTLYQAGLKDTRILREIFGLGVQDLSCVSVVEIYEKTLKSSDLSKTIKEMPMILKAYVFSEYRDYYSVEGKRKGKSARRKKSKRGEEALEGISLLSLYIAIAGLPISIVAKSFRDESLHELYVVPDTSTESLKASGKLYQLLHLGVGNRCISDYIKDMSNIEGLSFELATLIAAAIYIYQAARLAAEIPSLNALYNVFEMFRLVSIRPENRPQVVWERPLTITHIFRGLEDAGALGLLGTLESAARSTYKVKEVRDVVSQCITALFTYFETQSLDPLFVCGADSARVVRKLKDLGMSKTSATFIRLAQYLSKLARLAY